MESAFSFRHLEFIHRKWQLNIPVFRFLILWTSLLGADAVVGPHVRNFAQATIAIAIAHTAIQTYVQ